MAPEKNPLDTLLFANRCSDFVTQTAPAFGENKLQRIFGRSDFYAPTAGGALNGLRAVRRVTLDAMLADVSRAGRDGGRGRRLGVG